MEYDEVKALVHKTATLDIKKIERVQNPTLFKPYIVRKRAMDVKNGANEMRLFHGTTAGTCDKINAFGFNRSCSGSKNGKS